MFIFKLDLIHSVAAALRGAVPLPVILSGALELVIVSGIAFAITRTNAAATFSLLVVGQLACADLSALGVARHGQAGDRPHAVGRLRSRGGRYGAILRPTIEVFPPADSIAVEEVRNDQIAIPHRIPPDVADEPMVHGHQGFPDPDAIEVVRGRLRARKPGLA